VGRGDLSRSLHVVVIIDVIHDYSGGYCTVDKGRDLTRPNLCVTNHELADDAAHFARF